MNKKKTLPCPFCGREAKIVKLDPRLPTPTKNGFLAVLCPKCDLIYAYNADYDELFDTKNGCWWVWNTHATRAKIVLLDCEEMEEL